MGGNNNGKERGREWWQEGLKKEEKEEEEWDVFGSNMWTPQRRKNREKKRDKELCGSWLKMRKKWLDG